MADTAAKFVCNLSVTTFDNMETPIKVNLVKFCTLTHKITTTSAGVNQMEKISSPKELTVEQLQQISGGIGLEGDAIWEPKITIPCALLEGDAAWEPKVFLKP